MVDRLEVLALVPARGGSKSIPRKNIRSFGGHPLLAYSIAAGLKAECVTRVIVSTDDKEIAEVSRGYGAEVPFIRPVELAQDDTLDLPVFIHALQWLKSEEEYEPEVVVQLRPTSPLRPRDCVDRAVELLLASPEANSVRGVVPSGQNPYKMWRIDENGRMVALLHNDYEEPFNMPRQKLPPTYWQTGHIDAIRTRTIIEKKSMSGEVVLPLLIDPRYVVDIDTSRDWERAEWLISQGDIDFVNPGGKVRPLPKRVDLVVLDFDGVMTDNRVWVDAEGRELVAAYRGDGWGLARLREKDIRVIVLSRETNPVVAARCKKLGIPVKQGVKEKDEVLQKLFEEMDVAPAHTIYMGNDVNDLSCFPLVACALAVADAHPKVKVEADLILKRRGGYGAVRELCDILLERYKGEEDNG
jgi:YrbI family 3-deoxy-D-manno-octulosonate 8-phosphate phosphatase